MASRPPTIATRTADDGPARPERAQACLARIFICDRPLAAAVRYPLGALHEVTIGRGRDGVAVVVDGRSRRLELRFDDSWMSRGHATLARAPRRWQVVDAGSKNGTLLNGVAVQRATLADGDVLEIGQTLFVYRQALDGLGDAPIERDRPLSPSFDDAEDFGLAMAAALARRRQPKVRFLPAAARMLVEAWPIDLDRCLRSALVAAAGAPVAPTHLPSPLPRSAIAARPTFAREGELVAIQFGAVTTRLKHGDGLRYLAHLVERPGVEVHVLELVAIARRGRVTPSGADAAALGDAGPWLDVGAKAAYRQRMTALREVVDEATERGDHGSAARARAELELLASELARAVGLGGRDRKASSAAERARVTVTLRIRAAMKRVAAGCPPLGQHLERSLRTGTFCSYTPA